MDPLSDVLAAVQTGRPVSCRTVGRAPWAFRQGASSTAQFHVVISGTAWLTMEGAQPLHLAPGDVVLLPHGTPHILGDTPLTPPVDLESLENLHPPGLPMMSAVIGGDGAETIMLCGAFLLGLSAPAHPLLRSLPAVLHLPASRGTGRELGAAVDLLAGEIEVSGPGSGVIVESLIGALFAYVLRTWCGQGRECGAEWLAALSDPVLGRALHAVHADPGRAWTVSDLAAVAGLSRAAFSRRFTAAVGEPPLTYLTHWRMLRAQHLLRTAGSPLESIARDVGYESSFAFGKAFKRHTGVSPGRYRTDNRTPAPV